MPNNESKISDSGLRTSDKELAKSDTELKTSDKELTKSDNELQKADNELQKADVDIEPKNPALSIFEQLESRPIIPPIIRPRTHTVTFSNWNSDVGEIRVTVIHGDKVKRPEDPVWENGVFLDWYTSELQLDENLYDFDAPVLEDIYLIAGWAHIINIDDVIKDPCTVAFMNYHAGAYAIAVKVKRGDAVPKPPEPDLPWYTFTGWFTDKSCYEKYLYDFDTPVNDNFRLWPKYVPISFTVTFHNCNINPIQVQFGEKAPKPEDPIKKNFIFDGWYQTEDCISGTEYDFDWAVYQDTNIYAKWVLALSVFDPPLFPKSHTVTFDSQGWMPISSVKVTHGGTVKEPIMFVRPGYILIGWFTSNDSAATQYNFEWPVYSSFTLYARWIAVRP